MTFDLPMLAVCTNKSNLTTPQLGLINTDRHRARRGSTPQALLVAIGFGAFAALVLVHLQATLFLEVAHGYK